MKATNPSIAKLLLPALLLAFFHTQAGATIFTDSIDRYTSVSSGAEGSSQESGPSPSSTNADLGLFNPSFTSSASVAEANANTSASQISNITLGPTDLNITASLNESASLSSVLGPVYGGISSVFSQSYLSIRFSTDEPFYLTLDVSTSGDAVFQQSSTKVTLSDNLGAGQVAAFGADSSDSFSAGGPFSFTASGAAGDYTLTALVQDAAEDQVGTADYSATRSATINLDMTAAPEPSSWLLTVICGIALLGLRRRTRLA